MARLAFVVATSVGLLLTSVDANAMEFTLETSKARPNERSIVATGRVEPGDSEKLYRLVAGLPGTTVLISVALSSPGGDLLEGVRLATTIRNTRLTTTASDVCAAACFLMFAAGTRRIASEDARLGVQNISYRGAYVTASQAEVTARVTSKAIELNVPIAIVRKLEATPADDMAWLTQNDLRSMGVELVDTRVAGHGPHTTFRFGGLKERDPAGDSALTTETGSKKADTVREPPPNATPTFLAGRQARADYEAWFNSLSGEARTGAEWWAGVRTHASRDRLTCEAGEPLRVTGCQQAKDILRPSDERRRGEPDFRAGWNSL